MEGNFVKVTALPEAEERIGDGGSSTADPGESSLPPVLHFIWVGKDPPTTVRTRIRGWAELHPGYMVCLWGEEALAELGETATTPFLEELLKAAPNAAALSDVGRFAILDRFGGIYLDSDMEACRPISPLFAYPSGFVVRESKWLLTASAIGLPRGSVFGRVALSSMKAALVERGAIDNFTTGPPLITELSRAMRVLGLDGPASLPEWTFFPDNPFRFPRGSRSQFPPYGIHLFDHSWGEGDELRARRRVVRAILQLLLPRDSAVGNRRGAQLALRRITMIGLASALSVEA